MSVFTDPDTGKTYAMDPLTGAYREVAGTTTSATTRLPLRDQVRQYARQGQQSLGTAAEAAAPFLSGLGRYGPGIAYGAQQMTQPGGMLPGLAAIGGSAASTWGATQVIRGLTQNMPGPGGKLARFLGPALAGIGGGMATNQGVSLLTRGAAPGVSEPPRKIDTPLGPIYLNELAAQEGFVDRQRQREIDAYNTVTSMDLAKAKDLIKFQSDTDFQNVQRNLPIVNQMKNADMVRQQAMLASQGNQLARLNLLGTAGQLAAGGQAQTGETLRTMINANPYANVVLR
jgi:hypothetical protein